MYQVSALMHTQCMLHRENLQLVALSLHAYTASCMVAIARFHGTVYMSDSSLQLVTLRA